MDNPTGKCCSRDEERLMKRMLQMTIRGVVIATIMLTLHGNTLAGDI
jgi:hypothetical protein